MHRGVSLAPFDSKLMFTCVYASLCNIHWELVGKKPRKMHPEKHQVPIQSIEYELQLTEPVREEQLEKDELLGFSIEEPSVNRGINRRHLTETGWNGHLLNQNQRASVNRGCNRRTLWSTERILRSTEGPGGLWERRGFREGKVWSITWYSNKCPLRNSEHISKYRCTLYFKYRCICFKLSDMNSMRVFTHWVMFSSNERHWASSSLLNGLCLHTCS